ncbi:hypothetical protein BDW60DRAFT_131158 [Aspergillus nidulans var. acristatus]
MDVLLSRTAPKRRASLSLLFGSQKPTFAAALDEKPTRYYDFVDTPSPLKRPSPFISRQEISPELESKIRFSCSLLAYQIEQGIPSLAHNQGDRDAAQDEPGESITTEAQLVLKAPISNPRPKTASATGYDSGVGLTQQPSMQTMRVQHSQSGDASDTGDTRAISIFSNPRTSTSCSNTSAETSYPQSSSQSPRTNEPKPTTGAIRTGYRQPKWTRTTKAFLSESPPSPTLSGPAREKENIEDTNLFLNPTSTVTNLSSETLTLSSHPSPSLGLTRVPATTQHQKPTFTSYAHVNSNLRKSRSIIIDTAGIARFLTPDEEAQRNKALQHAVLSKMTPGIMRYNPTQEPPRQQSKQRSTDDGYICRAHRGHKGNSPSQRSRSGSRVGVSWTGIKAALHPSRWRSTDTGSRRLRVQVPLVKNLSRLFVKRE